MSSPADAAELVVLLDEDGLAVGISPKATSADPSAPDPDEVDEARWVDWAEFRAGVLNCSREISPECREQVEQLAEDSLAAEPRPCLALPPALRGRR